MQIYQGRDHRIEVDDRHLRITSQLYRGARGVLRLELELSGITGATFRAAGLLRPGHLQVTAVGVPRSNPGADDPATVIFARSQQQLFTALYEWLQRLGSYNDQVGDLTSTVPTWTAASPSPTAAAAPTREPQPRAEKVTARPRVTGFRRLHLTRDKTPYHPASTIFTAIDLETTGLDRVRDRIVEIGLVKFAADGTPIDEFATLVNAPGSSRAARAVHRINDEDLVGAPGLVTVLPEVLDFLAGTVMVGHNLDFEESFLAAAARAHRIPLPAIPTCCTLQTSRRQLEGRAFSLTAMHKTATGDFPPDSHTALGDARSTKEVLLWLLQQAPTPLYLTGPPPPPAPASPSGSATCAISCRPVTPVQASLAALLDGFPQSSTARQGDEHALAAYQELLQRSVEDGRLTFEEAADLTHAARRTRVTGSQLRQLHQRAWRSAFPDDVDADWATLSPTRRREMYLLADALGLPEITSALAHVIDSLAEPPPVPQARYLRHLRIAFAPDRDPVLLELQQRAVDHGARLAINITKTVSWLASADPAAEDRKHAAARTLGIPILDVDQATARLGEALREAELKAFERQRQLDEQQAQARRYQAEADAYWRPTWRSRELTKDPSYED